MSSLSNHVNYVKSWQIMSFMSNPIMLCHVKSCRIMSNQVISVKSCRPCPIMAIMSNHDKSCHLCKIVSIMSNHVNHVKSCHLCQITSFMSNHLIHVKSPHLWQITSFMSNHSPFMSFMPPFMFSGHSMCQDLHNRHFT
jgi:hypothetical protein